MAFDREAALAAGYTNDEINAYLQAERKKSKEPGPVTADVGEPPAPVTQITPVETSAGSAVTQVGLAAAPYAVPAAGALAAGAYGNKLYNAWDASAKAAQSLADAKLASEAGIAERAAQRAGQGAAQAVKPIAPVGAPAPAAPVAPAAPMPAAPQAAAAAEQPGVMQRAAQVVRQLALDKVMPNMGNLAKMGVGAGAALYSPNLGSKTPQTGRMRGMEINPLTGAPWTPEQIAQYEANAAQFDAQLAPPQMRR